MRATTLRSVSALSSGSLAAITAYTVNSIERSNYDHNRYASDYERTVSDNRLDYGHDTVSSASPHDYPYQQHSRPYRQSRSTPVKPPTLHVRARITTLGVDARQEVEIEDTPAVRAKLRAGWFVLLQPKS